MATLSETLLAPDIKPYVIADCEEFVDREVALPATGALVHAE
jgi:hypothetical protein